jgi:hypothetical protein
MLLSAEFKITCPHEMPEQAFTASRQSDKTLLERCWFIKG